MPLDGELTPVLLQAFGITPKKVVARARARAGAAKQSALGALDTLQS